MFLDGVIDEPSCLLLAGLCCWGIGYWTLGKTVMLNKSLLDHVQFQFLVRNHVNIWKTDIVLYFMGIQLV
jgi:hypothetical protein